MIKTDEAGRLALAAFAGAAAAMGIIVAQNRYEHKDDPKLEPVRSEAVSTEAKAVRKPRIMNPG